MVLRLKTVRNILVIAVSWAKDYQMRTNQNKNVGCQKHISGTVLHPPDSLPRQIVSIYQLFCSEFFYEQPEHITQRCLVNTENFSKQEAILFLFVINM